MSPPSRSEAIRSLSFASRSAVAAETAGRARVVVVSDPEPQAPRPTAAKTSRIVSPAAFQFPVHISRKPPGRSAITQGSLLETAAALHGQPRIAGEVRIGLRPLTERED